MIHYGCMNKPRTPTIIKKVSINKAIKAAKKKFLEKGLDFICIVKELDESLIVY